MPETVGTLKLKIARLERRLKMLEEQQWLSQTFPAHQASLAQAIEHEQMQLNQLLWQRSVVKINQWTE